MALNVDDFMTLDSLNDIVSKGEHTINFFMISQSLNTNNLVQQTIDHLKEKIKSLKKQEDTFLNAFDCSDIEQFKNRVRNYYHYTNLRMLTGSELRLIVNEFKQATDEKIRQRAYEIEVMINNLIHSDLIQGSKHDLLSAFENEKVTQGVAKEATDILIGILSTNTAGSKLGRGGKLSSNLFGTSKSIGNGKHVFEIAATLTTSAFDEHLKSFKERAAMDLRKYKKGSEDYEAIKIARTLLKGLQPTRPKTQITSQGMQQSLGVMWSDLTTEATDNKTGKGSDINVSDIELAQINNTIAEKILERLNLDSTMYTFAKGRIYDMLAKDPKMFFVGKSFTQLEGILGEISAVIAIVGLLGEKYRPKAIKWIGSQPGIYSKKQPSIDIVLREIGGIQFGVQVKNTMKTLIPDIKHYISFADKSIDEIFDNFLGPNSSDDIKNIYISDAFNVPYKKVGNKFQHVGRGTRWEHTGEHNKEAQDGFVKFLKIEDSIDSLVAQMNMYLMRFASDFLYMGMDKGFISTLATLDNAVIQTGGNFVYIVGSEVFFAKEMLKELEIQLQALQDISKANEQTSFKFETYIQPLKGEKISSFTIVEELNKVGSLSNHTIKMRSSWGFHK